MYMAPSVAYDRRSDAIYAFRDRCTFMDMNLVKFR